MNSSFSIFQKLKNTFFLSETNKDEFHVAFALFALTLSNEDFSFLTSDLSSVNSTKKYYQDLSEFSFIANSIFNRPHLWKLDVDHSLPQAYKNLLNDALLIDPSKLTPNQQSHFDTASATLYTQDGNDTVEHARYKKYSLDFFDLQDKKLDLAAQASSISPQDVVALDRWKLQTLAIDNQISDLEIEWRIKGYKKEIETAKATLNSISSAKDQFVQKWLDAKNKQLPASTLTTELGVEYLLTTCLPNAISDVAAKIWTKITLSKVEMSKLSLEFLNEIPPDIVKEFGDIEPELDSISFEYCFLDIQRPWFDESIINNRFWKFKDANSKISTGDDTMQGLLPAYPSKIILAKNIDLGFTPNSSTNEQIKIKLQNGERLLFGSLLLKSIPLNLLKEDVSSALIQQLTKAELSILNTVAGAKQGSRNLLISKNTVNLSAISNRLHVGLPQSQQPSLRQPMVSNMSTVRLATPKPATGNATASVLTMSTSINRVAVPIVANSTTASTFSGSICDAQGKPIPTVEVQLMNEKTAITQSVLTDENGTFSLSHIEAGNYQLKLKKTGFKTLEFSKLNFATKNFTMHAQVDAFETFQVIGVVYKKFPMLPNPDPNETYL
jgi:hypothetical protein